MSDVNKIKIEDVWKLEYKRYLSGSSESYNNLTIHDLNYYLNSDYTNSSFGLLNKNIDESFFISVYTDRFCCGLNILGDFQGCENIPQKDFDLLFEKLYEYRKGNSSRLLQCTIINVLDELYEDYDENTEALFSLITNCPYFVEVKSWVNPGTGNELIMYHFKN